MRRTARRRRSNQRRRRSRELALHPRHDILDANKDLRGLALSLPMVRGRSGDCTPNSGAWTASWVPAGWRPRGLPQYLLVAVLRPGGSLGVADQRRVALGGHEATVVSSMLEPRRVGTSLVGVGPVCWLTTGWHRDGSSIPSWGGTWVLMMTGIAP